MKKIYFKILLLTAIFACATSASMAQKSAKETVKKTIKEVEKIFDTATEFTTNVPPEQQCYLIPDASIIVEDMDSLSFDSQKTAIIPAGTYSFGVRYLQIKNTNSAINNSASMGGFSFGISYSPSIVVKSDLIHVNAVFEAGKYYTFNYEKYRKGFLKNDSIVVSLVELTDRKIIDDTQRKFEETQKNKEKKLEYLAYMEANPNRLDGTWSCEKKRMLNNFFMEYTIEGDKMKFYGKNKTIGKEFTIEGRIFYNENILILIPDEAYNKSYNKSKFVWYYTLTNGVLHIEGGKPFLKGGFALQNTGDFRKTN
ncbi:MAG: hypothetical protein LBG92_08295 [Prevotellaceae bacterium]|jgi:hypothetical protein|nr:hypothetical protein [Prevotellaceae bacterium]